MGCHLPAMILLPQVKAEGNMGLLLEKRTPEAL